MIDKYLRTNDQAELYAIFDSLGWFSEEILITSTHDYAIDEIGVINNVDDTDPENPIITPVPGYHCNIRFMRDLTEQETTALDPITIPAPNTPNRVWF